jgi:hypothetical protein
VARPCTHTPGCHRKLGLHRTREASNDRAFQSIGVFLSNSRSRLLSGHRDSDSIDDIPGWKRAANVLDSPPGICDVVCRSVPAAQRKRTHAADAASLINEADRKIEASVRGLLLERE